MLFSDRKSIDNFSGDIKNFRLNWQKTVSNINRPLFIPFHYSDDCDLMKHKRNTQRMMAACATDAKKLFSSLIFAQFITFRNKQKHERC